MSDSQSDSDDRMVRGLLEQAHSSLESAQEAVRDGHWAFAVRNAQDASELSIKALLLAAGHEPPKVHDLASALKEHRDELGRLGLGPGEVETMARNAAGLAEDRTRSLYGDEQRSIPPTELYGRSDAARALQAAESISDRCRDALTGKEPG